jgi:transposase
MLWQPIKEVAMHVETHFALDELKQIEREERNAGRSKRLRIVILALEGWTAPSIALSVGLSRRVCQNWVYRYNASGLNGLDDQRGGSQWPPLLSAEQEEQFRERLAAGPVPGDEVCTLRGADFQRILASEFGVLRSLASVYHLLHRLGYSCLRPRPKHRRSDPAAQERFQKELPGRLTEIAAAHPGRRLRVYFEDEARFGQQGTLTTVWAQRGSRPTAVRQTEYGYLWVLAVVCPETGHAEGLLSSRLNTSTVNVFLEQFSKTVPEGEHAVLIWDGAGFHTSGALRLPTNVSVIQLPAYSPEMNPVENLWHYLKSHYWSNRSYPDYAALEQAAMSSWQHAVLDTELMKTVCAAPYIKRADSN